MSKTTQDKIYQIWSEAIIEEELDVDKSFFELGGNSMLLMVVQAKLEKEFSCKLSVPDLFAYSTIKKLSAYIDTLMQQSQPIEINN